MKEFYIAQAQGLEIRFSNFPIMVIGSHDFPCFFLVENHVFPPIINNFLPICLGLPLARPLAYVIDSITNILAGSVSPGLDAPNLQVCLVFITCHFGKKY
jgi:hypothetical protein